LLERPGELVTRNELCQKLWPDGTFVDFESGLNTAINRLRSALDDSAEEPRFIETLPRLGYRFICPVTRSSTEAEATTFPIPEPKSESFSRGQSVANNDRSRNGIAIPLQLASRIQSLT